MYIKVSSYSSSIVLTILDNGNDPPTHVPNLEFSDEKQKIIYSSLIPNPVNAYWNGNAPIVTFSSIIPPRALGGERWELYSNSDQIPTIWTCQVIKSPLSPSS